MAYGGVPAETRTFLADMERDNTKPWFEANRDRYRRSFLAPAEELVTVLGAALRAEVPEIRAEPRINASIRRINRDTRFSADKSPYKCRMHLIFWQGEKPMASPGLHLVIQPRRVGAGAGHWMFGKPELARYHGALADDVRRVELESAIAQASAVAGQSLADPALKRVPRDRMDDPAGEWYRHKGLVVRGDIPGGDAVFGPGCISHLMDFYRQMLPLHRWLAAHVYGR